MGNQSLLGVSFDIKTRKSIADEVGRLFQKNDDDCYKILVVGSPNAWEIRDIDNHRGGKMDSVENVLKYAEESDFINECKLTYDSLKYDRPDLWGQYMITSRKND